MTKIYIVRHCETVGNADGLFQGVIDLETSPLGKAQLKALSKRFENISLDAVISSPLIRTRETAQAIVNDRAIPLIINDSIIELNGGIYEGVPFADIVNIDPVFPEVWETRPWDLEPPGGEKLRDAYNRIWKAVYDIAKEYKDKTVALSTHGGVTRFLICKILKNNIQSLNDIGYGDNTAVSLLEFDDDLNASLIYYNDSSHLTDDLKNAKATIPLK